MGRWADVAGAEPEVAELGLTILERIGIAYLATIRPDGSPRVHPVCPFFQGGDAYVGVVGGSPKRRDLIRDPRYVLHALPGPKDAEFWLRGRAAEVVGADRARVAAAEPGLLASSVLFRLDVDEVRAVTYSAGPDDLPVPAHRGWSAAAVGAGR